MDKLNSMMILIFFWTEIPILGKFDLKSQNCLFMMKFGT